MSRPLRIEFPGAIYHVMSRGVNGMETFYDDEDRRIFLRIVGRFVRKELLQVHGYCLMPNHYHLLCETPKGELNRWMNTILSTYSARFNLRHGRTGHLWQARYKSILVQNGAYLLKSSAYIHVNPCPSMVAKPENYPWSSYPNYIGGGSEVDWVTTSKVLSAFDGRRHYRRFVEDYLKKPRENPFDHAAAGAVYGGEEFVRRVLKLVENRADDPEVPALTQLRRTLQGPDPAIIRDVASEFFAGWSNCQQGRMAIYLLKESTWLRNSEIADTVGCTPSNVGKVYRSIRKRAESDGSLRRLLEAAHGRIISRSPGRNIHRGSRQRPRDGIIPDPATSSKVAAAGRSHSDACGPPPSGALCDSRRP